MHGLTLPDGGLIGGLADGFLLRFGHLIPAGFAHQQNGRGRHVLIEGVILGDLVVTGSVVGNEVVLSAVNNTGLQTLENLSVIHRSGLGT